jgi:ABC-type lipoprotein release transport system permease subunit
MNNERTASAIGTTTGHAQIHHEDFDAEPLSNAVVADSSAVVALRKSVEALPFVSGTAQRTVLGGMINSTKSARAVRIMGIWPEEERLQTTLADYMVEGDFFEATGRNRLVIGEKLAKRLGLKLRSKVVLTFQDSEGNLNRASFRISGIYKTLNATWDEFHLYVHHEDLEKSLGSSISTRGIGTFSGDCGYRRKSGCVGSCHACRISGEVLETGTPRTGLCG